MPKSVEIDVVLHKTRFARPSSKIDRSNPHAEALELAATRAGMKLARVRTLASQLKESMADVESDPILADDSSSTFTALQRARGELDAFMKSLKMVVDFYLDAEKEASR